MRKKFFVLLLSLVLLLVMTPCVFAEGTDTVPNAYSASETYKSGDTVLYNGIAYTAKWYTQGSTPGEAGSAWARVPEYNADGIQLWYEGMVVTGGSKVSYNGIIFEAKYWTNTVPGSDSSWTLAGGTVVDPVDPVDPTDPVDPVEPTDPTTPDTPSGATEWDSTTAYTDGAQVTYNGIVYTAKYYNTGENPSSSGAWQRAAEYDTDGIEIWYEGMICSGGKQVSYNGTVYEARYWTNTVPGSDTSWTLVSGTPVDPVDPTDPTDPTEPVDPVDPTDPTDPADPDAPTEWISTKIYYGKDQVTYNGTVYTAKYYNSGETPGTSSAWEREPEYIDGIIVWYDGLVCTEGDQVTYNGEVFQAKYWTNTEPGSDTSWHNLTNPDKDIDAGSGDTGGGSGSTTPANVTVYSDYTVDSSLVAPGSSEFKTVGYFPFYSSAWADNIDWDCMTHVIYAFAFPDGKGGLQDLDDVALVEKLISEGHAHGVKVMLGVGGWAYYGTIMEYQFDGCTATPELTNQFTDEIMALVDKYGFDGVDVDWEHPRAGSDSYQRYEAMMIQLRQKLGSDRLLTSAVLSGVTTDGTVYYDAAAHTANVMAVCDWFNVMAYDCECTTDFCKSVANYWCGTRGMPANKVCMGVPFYSYPGWSAYSTLVANDPTAVTDDMTGTYNYHNSTTTMQEKTSWAKDYGLGGMMIWELSQDTTDQSTSLIRAIHNTVISE